MVIESENKRQVHVDAQRLFHDRAESSDADWDASYDVRYKSRKQSSRHSERDGTAFASVALPAHYSALYAILQLVRQRLGPQWSVDTLYDWGAGTGSALWYAHHLGVKFVISTNTIRAAAYAFQKPLVAQDQMVEQSRLVDSTLKNYIGIEKRDGLATIGKRLLQSKSW
jgi:ribosomal protein RSM22 (predicted rRNA methylase)